VKRYWISALLFPFLGGGCGEPLQAVIVVPQAEIAGKTLALGDTLGVRTAGLFEPDGALFVSTDVGDVRVDEWVAPAPLSTEEVFVAVPQATLHGDLKAQDKGSVQLPFGRPIQVVRGDGVTDPTVLLFVRDGAPQGYVRAADVQDSRPTAKDMVAIAKGALEKRDLFQAREFAEAAMLADEDDVQSQRLMGALLIRDEDPEGSVLWLKNPPETPKAMGLPEPEPVKEAGLAYVWGTGVSLRKGPNRRARRLGLMDAGRRVEVHGVKGEWASVTVKPKAGRVLTATLRMQETEETADVAAPWDGLEATHLEGQTGYMAAFLLSKTAPDAAVLSKLGRDRVAAGQYTDAIVPLSRALAISPEDPGTGTDLLTAAVRTEQFNIALSVLDHQPERIENNAVGMEIQRISGCHGDLALARARVLPNEDVVREPKYAINDFDPAVLDVEAIGDAACVVDDEPKGMRTFRQSVMGYGDYLANKVFFCGCGDCYDKDELVDTGEFVEEYRSQYAVYKAERTREVAEQKAIFDRYVADYEGWRSQRSALLKRPAIRLTLTAENDLPAGFIALYSYQWIHGQWCFDTHVASRRNVKQTPLAHPMVPTGQTLELWVEGGDFTRTWGAILAPDLENLATEMESLKEESDRRVESGELPYDAMPESLTGRGVESTKGSSAEVYNECCGC